jgi:hypothetical protein
VKIGISLVINCESSVPTLADIFVSCYRVEVNFIG